MDALKNFCLLSYLSYRGLFHWLTPFPYFSNVILAPFLTLLNFMLIGRFASHSTSDQFGIGMIAYAIVWIYLGGITQSFANDRSGGTLHLLFASSANRAVAYFARGAGHYYNGPLTAVSTTILAVLFIDLGIDALNYLTYILAVIVISLSVVMFALLLGIFAAIYQNWFLPFSFAVGALLTLTGAIIPVDRLPAGLEQLGQVLPITHGLQALRGAFAGESAMDVSGALTLELMVAASYAVAGLALFTLVDRIARESGVLGGNTA